MSARASIGLMLRSVAQRRVSKHGAAPILRDGAEFIIGPRFARTRWRLLRMRAEEGAA
jgi:hypothetical protein